MTKKYLLFILYVIFLYFLDSTVALYFGMPRGLFSSFLLYGAIASLFILSNEEAMIIFLLSGLVFDLSSIFFFGLGSVVFFGVFLLTYFITKLIGKKFAIFFIISGITYALGSSIYNMINKNNIFNITLVNFFIYVTFSFFTAKLLANITSHFLKKPSYKLR